MPYRELTFVRPTPCRCAASGTCHYDDSASLAQSASVMGTSPEPWLTGLRQGFHARYRRASRLFDELKHARADSTYPRLLAKLARVDVLLNDDFAVAPVAETQGADPLKIVDDRYDRLLDNADRIIVPRLPLPALLSWAVWPTPLQEETAIHPLC
jgi:hypothetical protein